MKAFLNNSPKYIAPITPELVARYSERDQIFYKWNPHKSILILPLEVQGKAIGVINFVHTQASFELNDTEIHHIQCYVNQVAATINHAHLLQKIVKITPMRCPPVCSLGNWNSEGEKIKIMNVGEELIHLVTSYNCKLSGGQKA